jgi:hypothetical protein
LFLKGLAGKVVKEAVVTVIDAAESAGKQYAQDGKVSIGKVVTDVVSSKVAGALTKNVKVNSDGAIKATEKQLSRAERIAANDATGSGRAATVKELGGKVSSQKAVNQGVQQAASGTASNTMQAGVDGAVNANNRDSSLPASSSKPAVDNTAVKKPIPIL